MQRSEKRRRRKAEADTTTVPTRTADEIDTCVKCRHSNPPSMGGQQDEIEWLCCDQCGLWAHEHCAAEGSVCIVCVKGYMRTKEEY